jgi:hypothetical protein
VQGHHLRRPTRQPVRPGDPPQPLASGTPGVSW